jgi:3-deoxy-D-manno-octulosonate 8-phosphate phosphatase KdsC-like HAD superfamily phosphatase
MTSTNKIPSTQALSQIKAVVFDFDGVFTDNRVIVSTTGEEFVICDRGDGMGTNLLADAGIKMLILSKEKNAVVTSRGKKLNIEVIQGCDDKLPELKKWLKKIVCYIKIILKTNLKILLWIIILFIECSLIMMMKDHKILIDYLK